MLLPSLQFDHSAQHFQANASENYADLLPGLDRPLSVTFQLTRGCNFRCIYCSEPPGIRSRPLEEMKRIVDNLAGTRRIILSGGEPMVYRHFWELLEYIRPRFELVVLSTNASRITIAEALRLKEYVDYIDVTVDGPRRQHDLIRGHYDLVARGLHAIAAAEIPLSIICVYLPGNKDVMHYICQTGDFLDARKVKILTPIPKGESKNIFTEFVSSEEIAALTAFLKAEKEKNGWKVRITISDWTKIGPGHAILVEPDGRAVASPVWYDKDCLRPFGNLHNESGTDVWSNYEFKENHLKKYLETTLDVIA